MPVATPAPTVALRPAGPDDAAFLADLHADVRGPELAALGWDAATVRAFVDGQHGIRERAYRAAHPAADDAVVLVDGRPAGRLLLDRAADATHVVDLALLAAERGHGVGTHLLRSLVDEASATGRPVRLVVRRDNPARRLYEGLGFREVGSTELDLLLETP
ncbi:GNAT family N-acetyltransferase [Cellulomonas alba]|uniref:GNAT family N-acetyltransferase n=1 Tax=Cellulomonas alba TaxID=3053467 RepID=A0ABT7SHG7_9CELL|nr:GNAT family N-acetyltransferase [Cellulomonas alba]MDM7855484.1 GNAT family N-acetyltransferase [Cellulomonas alba]